MKSLILALITVSIISSLHVETKPPSIHLQEPIKHVQAAKVPEPVKVPAKEPEAVVQAPVQPQPVAPPPPAPKPVPVVVSGSHTDWMAQAGIPASDFGAADYIIMREGHYDPCVINGGAVDCSYATNGGQKAYGVCQSLPGSKMASAGADWATNPVTQLRWCHSYAQARYGGWQAAYSYWLVHRVW